MALVELLGTADPSQPTVAQWDWGWNDWCHVEIPRSCAVQKLRLLITIGNIDAVYWAAHADDFKAAVIQAFLQYTGASNVSIADGSTTPNAHAFDLQSNSVTMSVDVTDGSSGVMTDLQSQLTNDLSSSGGLSIGALNTAPPLAARDDPNSAFTITGTVNNTCDQTACGAHATCNVDSGCKCDIGYSGDGFAGCSVGSASSLIPNMVLLAALLAILTKLF